jgi:DNA-binding CsgD family transcriptional regulator
MNKNLLRSIMVLNGDTNAALADALGITPNRLSAKMNEWEGAQFNQTEIRIIKIRYSLTSDQIDEIFFC